MHHTDSASQQGDEQRADEQRADEQRGAEQRSTEHGAGVRAEGPTLDACFERIAATITSGAGAVRPAHVLHAELAAADPDALLTAWVDWVIAAMRERGLVLGRFLVRVDLARTETSADSIGGAAQGARVAARTEGARVKLVARAWGEPFDRVRHGGSRAMIDTRAVTARVTGQEGAWTVEAVLSAHGVPER